MNEVTGTQMFWLLAIIFGGGFITVIIYALIELWKTVPDIMKSSGWIFGIIALFVGKDIANKILKDKKNNNIDTKQSYDEFKAAKISKILKTLRNSTDKQVCCNNCLRV